MRLITACIFATLIGGCGFISPLSGISSRADETERAANYEFIRCIEIEGARRDDGISEAATIAMRPRPICNLRFIRSMESATKFLNVDAIYLLHRNEQIGMKILTAKSSYSQGLI